MRFPTVASTFASFNHLNMNAMVGYFQQRLDHGNVSVGTFNQRFWWNADHYRGPGSPIIMAAPQLSHAEAVIPMTKNLTLPGMYAQAVGGAVVVIEHRYVGDSSPVREQNDGKAMKFLTIENAVQDLVYFAQQVQLPFDPDRTSAPERAPWVLVGYEWSGSLTAWTSRLAPGTFWAYHASSAAVQLFHSFWQYFEPLEKTMSRGCSAAYKRVVAYVNRILKNGTAEDRQRLKDSFGFGELHDDDFASTIPVGLAGWDGKSNSWGGFPTLVGMCDYLEYDWFGNDKTEGFDRNSTENAVLGFSHWSKTQLIPATCTTKGQEINEAQSVACWNTHDEQGPTYEDAMLNNTAYQAWFWLSCTESTESWVASGPDDDSGLIPELYNSESWRRRCDQYFSNTISSIKPRRTVEEINIWTGGWNYVNSTRLMWSNFEYDPMLAASVSSDRRPGGPLKSTKEVPVFLLPKGYHAGDQWRLYGEKDTATQEMIDNEVAQIKTWVGEFYQQSGDEVNSK